MTTIMEISGATDNINYTRPNDAGMDLKALEATTITAHARTLVHTGVYAAIPANHVGLICPRSGLALKQGITVLNAPGIIDPNYRGEIGVILHNTTDTSIRIDKGDRIAQLVITPCAYAIIRPVPYLDAGTERGTQGFGSSGK